MTLPANLPVHLSLHPEDAPPSVCIGIGDGDHAVYGGLDATDVPALTCAIESGHDLTLHASSSAAARASVTWTGNTLTVRAHTWEASRPLDRAARTALCAALRALGAASG